MEGRIFSNPDLWKVWCWCRMKANHKNNWMSISTGRGFTEIEVKKGQFVFGRNTAAKELNMKPSTIWKRMLKLKTLQNLNIQSDKVCSIITICNWDSCKPDPEDEEQAFGKTSERQVTQTRMLRMLRKEPFLSDSIEIRLSRLLFSKIRERNQKQKEPNFQSWGNEIDKMLRVDKRSSEEIEAIILWSQADDFWQNNILSTSKLRKQFDSLLLKSKKSQSKPNEPKYLD